ncbi:urease accessory protein UreF [Novosphingobium sp. Leaf2]|uniref:urease accessory protein UreF n=1 Tax=Novosphingobium sp. Leaf2 TaxID=1735670 RepID=UPI0006F93866|nr:urease accessory UreF family protein [Novosphingobium sp. Leaf2]KQM14858.1 urease accessory protein [Novosphingobium sp. Leaf2]
MTARTIITITPTITMPMDDGTLFDLLSWMSPAWPIGAFAHSGGLEWAVEAGHVRDLASTVDWIGDLLEHGPLHNEAVFFLHALRAATAGDADMLVQVAELAAAAQSGFERHLETTAQGAAFRRIALHAAAPSGFAGMIAAVPEGALAYPVAAGCLFGFHAVPEMHGLVAYLHGCVANLVSAAQRLVPLGQTDAQRALHALRVPLRTLAADLIAHAGGDPFLALRGCTLVAEIGCMAHETTYTRLFRT